MNLEIRRDASLPSRPQERWADLLYDHVEQCLYVPGSQPLL